MFPSIDHLMRFVRKYISNGKGRGILKAVNDAIYDNIDLGQIQ